MENVPYQSQEGALRDQREAFLASLVSTMDPQDVVNLFQRERAADSPLSDELSSVIEYLPEHDFPQACEVITRMTKDHNPANRRSATTFVSTLAPHAPRLAVRLWDQLMRDEEPRVRVSARQLLEDYITQDKPVSTHSEALIPGLGFTWQEARDLLHGNDEANAGRNIHRLGSAAMRDISDRPTT